MIMNISTLESEELSAGARCICYLCVNIDSRSGFKFYCHFLIENRYLLDQPLDQNFRVFSYSPCLLFQKRNHAILQSLLCTDCDLRWMRQALPESSLEQPRLQIHCLALHQPIGANRPDINYANRTMNETVLEDATDKALNRILRGRKEFLVCYPSRGQ